MLSLILFQVEIENESLTLSPSYQIDLFTLTFVNDRYLCR